jgi:hypothetical protein
MLFLSGCSSDAGENKTSEVFSQRLNSEDNGGNKTSEVFCRVLNSEDNGMYVWTENFGHIYVKYGNIDLEISPLDTVVIEFSESDLISANGQFTDFFGKEQNYLYILENPQNIRYTTPEEPTFS